MKLFSQFFSRFFHNFSIILTQTLIFRFRILLKISHERFCLDRRRRITLQFIQMANFKKSFATEKTLALISEIFWNSEHFFILYCTVMSKIFILNLHMLVMHRLCHRYRKGISSSAPSRDTNEIYLLLFIPVPNENVATWTPKNHNQ